MGITSFGNPAVWWMTIPVVLWGIFELIRNRKQIDLGILTAVVGFFSLYTPWILITRTAFIYHFFPCVVFVVLLLGHCVRNLVQEDNRLTKWMWVYGALVFILFIAYYPVLTGLPVPESYVRCLAWFPGWVLG